MTTVSVIVPVYNVEDYLRKCIDSIIDQSYKNIEIILVDDGSPDGCPAICDEYAKWERRIKVIHKGNGGLSDARNSGILESSGEYIAFVDSDDYIAADFIKVLLDQAVKHEADISVCNFYRVYDQKLVAETKPVHFAELTNIEAMRDVFAYPSLCDIMSCNKLYKRELFVKNEVAFPVGKIYEDDFVTYKLCYYADRVVFIDEPLYYYTQREGSITRSRFSKKTFDMVEASRGAGAWVMENNLPLTQEVEAWQLSRALNLLNAMIESRTIHDDTWNDASSWIIENRKSLVRNIYISRKRKALVFAVSLGRTPYIFIRALRNSTLTKS